MDGGRLALQNSTGSGTATWECGGVSNDAGSAARVGSTIVARNATYSSRPPDVRGAFASPGYNLIGVGFGATGFNGPGGAAAAGACDQRGPGFARVVGGRIDIGAFEVQPAPTVSSVVVNNGAAQRSLVTTLTVTFDSVVTILPGAFTLPRVGLPDGGAGAGATVGAIAVDAQTVNGATVATLTFSGANVTAGSLDDGNWTLPLTTPRSYRPPSAPRRRPTSASPASGGRSGTRPVTAGWTMPTSSSSARPSACAPARRDFGRTLTTMATA